MKKIICLPSASFACTFVFVQNVTAGTIVFESLPTANSNHVSRHGTLGPVLADDFIAKGSGTVTGVVDTLNLAKP